MNNRLKTSVMTVYAAFIVIIAIFISIVLDMSNNDIIEVYTVYTIFALFIYISMFYTSKKSAGEWNSYHIFLAMTFAFYFGGQFLVAFGYYDQLATRMFSVVDNRVTLSAKIEAMNYILIVISLINFGYIWATSKSTIHSLRNDLRENDNKISLSLMYQIATVLFVITVVPTFLSLGKSVVLSQTLGHLGYRSEKAAETGIWFLFSYISGWFRPACFMMLLSATNRRKKIVPLIGVLAYSALYLMTGSRYQIIEIAYCLFAIEFVWSRRILNRKQIVKFLIAALILFTILKAVGFARADTAGAGIFSLETLQQVFKENIIYEMFYTTSTTFTTISNAIMRCPSEIPFNFGKGYIGALTYILPSALRPADMTIFNVDVEQVFSHLYYNWDLSGYGSSFLAEMYYNLGKLSYMVCPLLGYFMGKIVSKLKIYANGKNAYGFFCLMLLFSELVWGVRSDLFLIPRHMFLYVFLPWVVLKILAKKVRR